MHKLNASHAFIATTVSEKDTRRSKKNFWLDIILQIIEEPEEVPKVDKLDLYG